MYSIITSNQINAYNPYRVIDDTGRTVFTASCYALCLDYINDIIGQFS